MTKLCKMLHEGGAQTKLRELLQKKLEKNMSLDDIAETFWCFPTEDVEVGNNIGWCSPRFISRGVFNIVVDIKNYNILN